MNNVMSSEELKEFRILYRNLFPGSTQGVAVTPEVQANPLYKRYCQLAPLFYTMMVRSRRKHGM
jgi:hypothetical protein